MESLKKVSVLGSTGSIGKNALRVAAHLKEQIQVVGIAAKSNIDLLEQQALEHHPELIGVYDESLASVLQKRLPHMRVVGGVEGVCAVAALSSADTVIAALVGMAGLIPTAAAIEAGKTVGLANKEVLVAAGEYIIPLAKKHGVALIPVDSEHNAIFQCIHQEEQRAVRRIIITGSGGVFRGWNADQLQAITPDMALKHPNFSMGAKVSIDSSTLMNKGLEVIEAYWLFGMDLSQIEVVIHPQQKIHGMVEFVDGSIIAQMCEPDMLVPIQYAMTFPSRERGILKPFDFMTSCRLDFEMPNRSLFRCLDLSYAALTAGGTLPCFMNAANEILVARFLNKEIAWIDIGIKLEQLMMGYENQYGSDLESFLSIDQMARQLASLC